MGGLFGLGFIPHILVSAWIALGCSVLALSLLGLSLIFAPAELAKYLPKNTAWLKTGLLGTGLSSLAALSVELDPQYISNILLVAVTAFFFTLMILCLMDLSRQSPAKIAHQSLEKSLSSALEQPKHQSLDGYEEQDQYLKLRNDYYYKPTSALDYSYANALESIALLQASLANILNMGAEEINTVLDSTESLEDILKINDEVRKNINKALHFEQLIFSMLESFNEIIKKP